MSALVGGGIGGSVGALAGWLGIKYGLGISNVKAQALGAGAGGLVGAGAGMAIGQERAEQANRAMNDKDRARLDNKIDSYTEGHWWNPWDPSYTGAVVQGVGAGTVASFARGQSAGLQKARNYVLQYVPDATRNLGRKAVPGVKTAFLWPMLIIAGGQATRRVLTDMEHAKNLRLLEQDNIKRGLK